MRLPLLLILALAASASAAEPAKTPKIETSSAVARKPDCIRDFGVERLDDANNKPAVRRLADLPPANHELTVLRRIDGCPAPVVVRYGVDAPPDRPAPKSR